VPGRSLDTAYMPHIYPNYIPYLSRIYIEAGWIRDTFSLYAGNTCLCHALSHILEGRLIATRLVYLNIKTQAFWQDKSQALISGVFFIAFPNAKEGTWT
jgi:hypothetical protein